MSAAAGRTRRQALALFLDLGDRAGQAAVHQELGRAEAARGPQADTGAALASRPGKAGEIPFRVLPPA